MHPFAPTPINVYVMLLVGLNAVAAVLILPGNQVYELAPVPVKTILLPTQTVAADEEIVTVVGA